VANEARLSKLAGEAQRLAKDCRLSFATAESCTAGKLAVLLSEAPRASEHLHGGIIAYTKPNKVAALGLSADMLRVKGAVCCMMELGIDRILFAVDWPFVMNEPAVRWMERMPLADEDKAKILSGNAKRLLRM
jgi:hypothetical protein